MIAAMYTPQNYDAIISELNKGTIIINLPRITRIKNVSFTVLLLIPKLPRFQLKLLSGHLRPELSASQ
jgi:hypothetical protein